MKMVFIILGLLLLAACTPAAAETAASSSAPATSTALPIASVALPTNAPTATMAATTVRYQYVAPTSATPETAAMTV